MRLEWGSNWEDDLAGAPAHAAGDPDLAGLGEQVRLAFEQVFMFYLPRICEHCLNPSCVASCPSGAMYKREEDGIVLVDQDRCRGWRFCVSGCPYKKVYFNHRTGKAEKCTLCFPRIEAGQPTICSETCVGRLRYLGLFLYDADPVLAAAATPEPQDLHAAQLSVFLDPEDPAVQAAAAAAGHPADWLDAARRSPSTRWPSGTGSRCRCTRSTARSRWSGTSRRCPRSPTWPRRTDPATTPDPDQVFAAIDALRVPAEYLANLFTAGNTATVRRVLRTLAAVRALMRADQLGQDPDPALPASVGADRDDLADLYRLLAIAKYGDRYVVPPAHAEDAGLLMAQHEQLFCSADQKAGPVWGAPARRPARPSAPTTGACTSTCPPRTASHDVGHDAGQPVQARLGAAAVPDRGAVRRARPAGRRGRCGAPASREPFGRFLTWLRATPPITWRGTTWRRSTCAAAAPCT